MIVICSFSLCVGHSHTLFALQKNPFGKPNTCFCCLAKQKLPKNQFDSPKGNEATHMNAFSRMWLLMHTLSLPTMKLGNTFVLKNTHCICNYSSVFAGIPECAFNVFLVVLFPICIRLALHTLHSATKPRNIGVYKEYEFESKRRRFISYLISNVN